MHFHRLFLCRWVAAVFVMLAARVRADAAPAVENQFTSDAAAQAVWKPMRGSAPAAAGSGPGGGGAVRLPCNFAGTDFERASWDRAVSLDLAACRGVQFDYIRYPDGDHCFCAGCRERFGRTIGTAIERWPADALAGGRWRTQWLEWRRSNITAVVRAVSEQARAVKPAIKISAAVFRNWTTDRDGVGQDWKLWCDRGWLDFVCPMNYTGSARQFDTWVGMQKECAGRTPVYPGIGVSSSSSRLPVDEVIGQIEIARRHATQGFILFNYGGAESRELVPLLGLGTTARAK